MYVVDKYTTVHQQHFTGKNFLAAWSRFPKTRRNILSLPNQAATHTTCQQIITQRAERDVAV